jgi:glutamate/tyrosine decarboxylase-like PLP-dependent enzyme
MNFAGKNVPSLAEAGVEQGELFEQLAFLRSADNDWHRGRSALHVYWAGDDVQHVAERAYAMFMNSNALAPRAFPSLKHMEEQLISMSLPLWNAPITGAAALTSGGTESIILGMQAIRHWSRETRPHLACPVVLAPRSAHPAYEKAAALLDMEVRRLPLGGDYRIKPGTVADALSGETVALVGSAPCLPFGTMDPIDELGDLALAEDLWLHVDACLGGYLAPFVRELGHQVPAWDFSIPGVRSISADLHKYGYAPKGISMIAYRDAEDLGRNRFVFDDWPKGAYRTNSMAGTRSGGTIAAAWAVMTYLGKAGYRDRAARIMAIRSRIEAGLANLGGVTMLGPQPLGILAFSLPGCASIVHEDALAGLGWYTSRISHPPGLHMTVTPVHEQAVDAFLADLARLMSAPARAALPVAISTY